MSDTLQRLELKHQTGLDALCRQVHQAAVRLENGSDSPDSTPVPLVVLPAAAGIAGAPSPRLVWVLPSPPEPRISVHPEVTSDPWRPFVAGMLSMLIAGALIMWGSTRLGTNPGQQALMSSVAPLPVTLSQAQLEVLPPPEKLDSETWFPQARTQLETLSRLPPYWSLDHGSRLTRQAKHLWPAKPETVALERQWPQLLSTMAASPGSIEGWHRGMQLLLQLARRLDALDEKKGKYMTVSELKSQVFTITQAFNQTMPAEELLRQLAVHPDSVSLPAALSTQTTLHLKQLLARYALLTSADMDDDSFP